MIRTLIHSRFIRIGLSAVTVGLAVRAAFGIVFSRQFHAVVDGKLAARARLPGSLLASRLLGYDALADHRMMASLAGEELVDGMLVGTAGNVIYFWNQANLGREVRAVPGV